MNNVKTKTNRTPYEAVRVWAAADLTDEEAKFSDQLVWRGFLGGWNAALESVVQEPALTRGQALTAIIEWETAQPREMNDGLLDRLFSAGRIPAPATVEAPQDFSIEADKARERNLEFVGVPAPQEGELTRGYVDFRMRERGLSQSPRICLLVDDILARHQQALSAREQAVRGEDQKRFDSLDAMHDAAERTITALRAELAAEKLANEGKYAIGDRVELGFKFDGMGMIVAQPDDGTSPFCSGTLVRRHAPTLTNEQMAEAWVQWWVGERLERTYSNGWKELAILQANGETIEQIYRRDVLGAPKEQEES